MKRMLLAFSAAVLLLLSAGCAPEQKVLPSLTPAPIQTAAPTEEAIAVPPEQPRLDSELAPAIWTEDLISRIQAVREGKSEAVHDEEMALAAQAAALEMAATQTPPEKTGKYDVEYSDSVSSTTPSAEWAVYTADQIPELSSLENLKIGIGMAVSTSEGQETVYAVIYVMGE